MKGKEKVEDDPPPLMTSPVAHPKRDADGRFKCPYCDYKSKKASHHRSVRVGLILLCRHYRLSFCVPAPIDKYVEWLQR
ncbi:hypothetical protein NFJ02_08g137610 [Pycnococcus provasolii]